MTKDLAKRKDYTPIVADYGDDAGVGFEKDVVGEDIAIPFLTLLQALSPQVAGPQAIEGAEAGMFFNTATKDVYPDGIEFIPVAKERYVVEWVPRDDGGGYVGRHERTDDIVLEAKKKYAINEMKSPAGNDLVDTAYVYGIALTPDGETAEILIAFKSSALGPYRGFNTEINKQMITTPDGRKQRVPIFANRVRITSFDDADKKGRPFKNFVLSPVEGTKFVHCLLAEDSDLYQIAKEMNIQVVGGNVKVDFEKQGGTSEDDGKGAF